MLLCTAAVYIEASLSLAYSFPWPTVEFSQIKDFDCCGDLKENAPPPKGVALEEFRSCGLLL